MSAVTDTVWVGKETTPAQIEALWGIIDPILTAWHEDRSSPIREYPAGSAGPTAADALLDGGRKWRRL